MIALCSMFMVYASRRCQVDPIFGMAAVFWIGCITGIFGGRYRIASTHLSTCPCTRRCSQPSYKKANALSFLVWRCGGRPAMISGAAGAMAVVLGDLTKDNGPLGSYSR